jgi:hypothetical protein
MDCQQCGTSLSVQDIARNEWIDNSEVFFVKCPSCEYETIIKSFLFVSGHISKPYLAMIVVDSQFVKSEKLIDYIPEKQRQTVFQHLSTCKVCSDMIEEIRLNEISKELQLTHDVYEFFLKQSKEVLKEIEYSKTDHIKFNYDKVNYEVNEHNLFRKNTEKKIEKLYFYLEKESINVGIVSFVRTHNKLFLERIWLKSQKRLEKEKQFLTDLRSGKIRVLLDLVQKIHNFV